MIPVIADYVRNYPEVRVDIRFSERFVNLVEEGIELALRIGNLRPARSWPAGSARCSAIWSRRRLICTAARHRGRPKI